MEFRILGPLEVVDDGRELTIRGRKLRALLTLLLLNANQVVARERLIDELWGDDPPPSAAGTLQVYVSRLRRELGDSVVTRGGGYLVSVEPGCLDLERFETLVDEGRAALVEGAPERAEERLRAGLALWRGPPLAEFDVESFARLEADRLEEIRLDALEQRIEAELALGRLSEAVEELEALVARHPFRERPRAQLMLALYRSGRQADALEVYRDAREALVRELGIEPGPRLRDLQKAILAQDPALDGPQRAVPAAVSQAAVSPVTVPDAPEAPRASPPRRRALAVAALAAGLVVAATLLLVAVVSGGDEASPPPLTDDSHAVVAIDPETNEVTTAASVGTNPGPLAFEPESGSLWVGNVDDESVTRIDLHPVRTGRTIAVGQRPAGLAAAEGSVWVVGAPRTGPYVTARRIDARFDTARQPIRIESLPEGGASVALGTRALWVAPSFGLLTRLDPATGSVWGPRIDAGHSPTAVAADGRAVWTADKVAGGSTVPPDPSAAPSGSGGALPAWRWGQEGCGLPTAAAERSRGSTPAAAGSPTPSRSVAARRTWWSRTGASG